MKKNVLLMGALISSSLVAQADVIANWTFESTAPTTAETFNPETGSGQATISTGGTISSPVGNASSHSFSSTAWDVGDYFQFSVSTSGFEDITISYDQTGSNTGPADYDLAYSLNGVDFTTFSSYTVSNDSWSSGGSPKAASNHSFDLSSITALDDATTVFFKVIDSSTTSVNGGTVAAGGTDRVDNFVVNATVAPVPEPSVAVLATLGGLVSLLALRRKR